MSSLPSGIVTFLFTDIESSTKLARAHPGTWESVLGRHHTILREAIEANNGYIFQVIGDAFCAAFHRSGQAINAAIKAQEELQNEDWGEVPIRVRMGIHTGEAEIQEDGQYQGYLSLSLVQRVMSAGHGEQILISDATENLLRGQLHEGVDLLDMRRHNFKDVPHAVRVFQVKAPGLQRDFPPLRTLDILPNNLPVQLTSFVGREKELSDVKRLLKDTHMLSLIGPGGTGKTRLSIKAANEVLKGYPDGVWLVDLAPIIDPLLVPKTTVITIGLRSEPQRPVIDMLCDYLDKKKLLLILDNCEHLVDACAQMAERILRAAADVQILASSREALGIAGEVTYRVPSLGMPDVDNLPSLESLSQYEAVKLFIDRATSAIPDFKVTNENAASLAQICHRLDGIPLAIELAAGKIRVLGVEQIAKRLDDRFKLLTGGRRTAMERHQTLRAAVDWSYNLLPLEEQILFRRLSVFRGGWNLEAAESICEAQADSRAISSDEILDLLEGLINKSMVITDDEGGTSRYRMLETIRQYANEKLVDSGESEALRERHLEYFLDLAESAAPYLIRHEQLEWLPLLDDDYDNLRLAFEWSLNCEKAESALSLCANLLWFWENRGYWQEGLSWIIKALALPFSEDRNTTVARVRALYTRAHLEWNLGNMEGMRSPAEESFALAMEVSDKKDIAIARYYAGIATMLSRRDDVKASKLLKQSFTDFQELNEPFWMAITYFYGGEEYLGQQKKLKLSESFFKLLDFTRKTGDRLILADSLEIQVSSLLDAGQVDKALENLEESDRLHKQLGAEGGSISLLLFAEIARDEGDYTKAKSLFKEMQERLRLRGEKFFREICLTNLARLAMEEGELDEAQKYLEEAFILATEVGFRPKIAWCLANQGNLFHLQGNVHAFKENIRRSLSFKDSFNNSNKIRTLSIFLFTLNIYYPDNSAKLMGAIDNFQREIDEPLTRDDKYYYNRAEIHVREELGDEEFESAFAEGQKMSLDDALDLVLKTIDEESE